MKEGLEKVVVGEGSLFEEMINASPSCLKVLNAKGELLKMNARGLNLIEAEDFNQVDHADVYSIVHDKDRARFIEFNEKICSGERGTLLFRIVGLKGTMRWMETYAAPFSLSTGETAHIAITNDVTDRVLYETELKRREDILKESAKLASLGEMAGGIAHEVNNPLMIIRGKAKHCAKMVSVGNYESESILKDLNVIEETAVRISKIVNGLKAFSRSEAEAPFELIDLSNCIQSSLDLSSEKFKSFGIVVKVALEKNLQVLANPIQISQVILNLLNNAFDVVEKLKDPYIEISAHTKGDLVKVAVRDSGPGVDSKNIGKLMDPFFTTKDIGKGTGLGLSVSHSIVKAHGGTLYFNSESPLTEFVMELPLAQA